MLAYDSRVVTPSQGHLEYDVLGAVRELLRRGVTRIVVGGASAGGDAAMGAAAKIPRSTLAGLIVLSSPGQFASIDGFAAVRRVVAPSFFGVGSRDTAFTGDIRKLYADSAAKKKQLLVVASSGPRDAATRHVVGAGELPDEAARLRRRLAALGTGLGRGFRPVYSSPMAGIDQLVDELERSYKETQERMSDPAVYNDHREAAEVGRRLKELEEPHKLATEWRSVATDLEEARGDGDLRELVPELEQRVHELEEELKLALVETDPADSKDVIVEIRQGVGGDEAALWAGDLYRMLARYAERRGFKTEELSSSPSDGGGFKELVFGVKGNGAYSVFKYEAGTHRVQRVPETESQGRIHTSTATVAVMPEAEDVEVEIDANDLKIDVYRSTGPGGQSVNTTDSAVRITHLPTGLVVAMQDEKSQLQNKTKAMRVLRARLYEQERDRQEKELAATRRSQIGGGERAEKIRTYNFPENRLTDHRIKLTAHQLKERILEGELDEFTEALTAEDRRQALEA